MLAALLIPLFVCPPTSIPASGQQSGVYLASPYGVPHELAPTSVAPRSLPTAEVSLPLWDLDASLAEVEAQLALAEPPAWAPWVEWVLVDAGAHDDTPQGHLIDALASPDLSAEHLAWWRSVTPDPIPALQTALGRSESARTRALLTTTLALTEYARSCPVPVDIDGACRAPGTNLLLRRSEVPLESARRWTQLARTHWATLELDAENLATRALWAELELAITTADYESLLDAEIPADLSFLVEDWRKDSGVATWEAEYARQVKRAGQSKARLHAWLVSSIECTGALLDLHQDLLWIDARSSGVVLLRDARMLIAFAEALDEADERERVRIFGKPMNERWAHGERQSDVIDSQAREYLALCLEHSRATLDAAIEQACTATLARLDDDTRPLVEFVGEARASSTMQHHGVIGEPD